MSPILLHPQVRLDESIPWRAPCIVLRDDFMCPKDLGMNKLAKRSGIPAWQIRRVLADAPIYAEEAFGLARAFHTSPLYWLLLQARCDMHRFQAREVPSGWGAY